MHRRLDRVIYGWQNGVIHSTSFSRWCIFIIISSFLLCVLCFVVVGRLFVSFSLTVSLSLSRHLSTLLYPLGHFVRLSIDVDSIFCSIISIRYDLPFFENDRWRFYLQSQRRSSYIGKIVHIFIFSFCCCCFSMKMMFERYFSIFSVSIEMTLEEMRSMLFVLT